MTTLENFPTALASKWEKEFEISKPSSDLNGEDRLLHVMEEMEGHSKSFLYKDVSNAQSYLIVSEWSEEQAFNDFMASDKFKNVVNWGKENILAGRPSHTVYKH